MTLPQKMGDHEWCSQAAAGRRSGESGEAREEGLPLLKIRGFGRIDVRITEAEKCSSSKPIRTRRWRKKTISLRRRRRRGCGYDVLIGEILNTADV